MSETIEKKPATRGELAAELITFLEGFPHFKFDEQFAELLLSDIASLRPSVSDVRNAVIKVRQSEGFPSIAKLFKAVQAQQAET